MTQEGLFILEVDRNQGAVAHPGELVRVLVGIYRYRFTDSPQFLGAWAGARQVVNPVLGCSFPGARRD